MGVFRGRFQFILRKATSRVVPHTANQQIPASPLLILPSPNGNHIPKSKILRSGSADEGAGSGSGNLVDYKQKPFGFEKKKRNKNKNVDRIRSREKKERKHDVRHPPTTPWVPNKVGAATKSRRMRPHS